MEQEILSVGIDIGTTTTQLVFSKITVCSIPSSFSIAKVKITHKTITYKSKIYFTPLISYEKIDLEKIKKIIILEYKNAGINKKDISTGAIIITGETSRKENAQEVLNTLSEFAGDFVVATAGPDLEAMLAGYGSGASELSKKSTEKVINFDVGGGTTNVAIFEDGEAVDCFALDIGGRLIKFGDNFEITYISKKITQLIKSLNLDLRIGIVPEFNNLKKLTDAFAMMLLKIGENEILDEVSEKLFIAHKNRCIKTDCFMFSGGVSEFVYKNATLEKVSDIIEFGDIGPLLGYSINEVLKKYKIKIAEPKEKIRATVIGAGSHSMAISGSTIVFEDEMLPIKNIPIIKFLDNDKEITKNSIREKVEIYEGSNVAIAFKGPKSPSYYEVKALAEAIVEGLNNRNEPIIVIIESDFAKALGQTIKNILNSSKKVICIDGIKTKNGDYVDIGKSISSVVPVVIKTLIFES